MSYGIIYPLKLYSSNPSNVVILNDLPAVCLAGVKDLSFDHLVFAQIETVILNVVKDSSPDCVGIRMTKPRNVVILSGAAVGGETKNLSRSQRDSARNDKLM
jgi:hypothetical protein